MINKKSIERGLFNISYYKSQTATAKDISLNERIIFCNPLDYINKGIDVKGGNKFANYNLLDKNGFIKEGSVVAKGQKVVTVGMINIKEVYKEVKKGIFTEFVKSTQYTDVSLTTDNSIYGIVNKVFYSHKTSTNNSSICKVRFLKIRKPEFGDKHASRHGQKGVIGMIIPEENMPFTKDGIKPDIIINPHAIPSRMTIGHLVECAFAKLCCLNGSIGNGSVFIPFDENKIYNELSTRGFNSHGNEILYNGMTGQQINCEIFIGPTFYFRLKHMVADKINSRGHDRDKIELPKIMLTRQPTSGRRKGGGLRIGEMERDSIISHGASLFIQESMMERADKYNWAICKRCGILSIYNPSKKNKKAFCKLCNKSDIVVIETPYSFKLLIQELETMGIEMRLNTEKLLLPPNKDIEDFSNYYNNEYDVDDNLLLGGDSSITYNDDNEYIKKFDYIEKNIESQSNNESQMDNDEQLQYDNESQIDNELESDDILQLDNDIELQYERESQKDNILDSVDNSQKDNILESDDEFHSDNEIQTDDEFKSDDELQSGNELQLDSEPELNNEDVKIINITT